jgi:hypothetical protein
MSGNAAIRPRHRRDGCDERSAGEESESDHGVSSGMMVGTELAMPIDIDRFSEDELRDLHHRVTERLRLIHQMRAHGAMMNFSIGDRVAFKADGRRITGVLSRYNRKTVTVIADGGHRWNVSPGFLERADPRSERVASEAQVVVTPVPQAASHLLARSGRGHGARS